MEIWIFCFVENYYIWLKAMNFGAGEGALQKNVKAELTELTLSYA